MNKNILITGGCGFVGSNIAVSIKRKYPSYTIYAVDNLKRRGSELNLPALTNAGIKFIHADVRVKTDFVFDEPLHAIIDAAAEPSVLAGINGSVDYLVQTNFNGTVHLLELAIKHSADFIFLSTSRVYPISELKKIKLKETATRFELVKDQEIAGCTENGISETLRLNGSRSFYGTTKLASELMIQEFQAFSGLKAVINRCGVIAGPGQMGKVDQGVVVLWMARHFWKKDLSYIGYGGTGKQVRDILHIQDLFRLIDFQLHNMDKAGGKLYNAGGGIFSSASLCELTSLCEKITGNKIQIKKVEESRAGDIPAYITDNNRVTNDTGWAPENTVEKILTDIYGWLKNNEQQLKSILNE